MNKDFEYEYKIVSEVSAPTFYDVETNKVLEESCDQDTQCYWVVIYNKAEGIIEEWLDRFYDLDNAQRFLDNINKGDE